MDIEKLKDYSKHAVTISILDTSKVDKNFVKSVRLKYNLTQVALANILGVKKKTIEKWEQGVNKVSGSSAMLLTLIDNDKSILDKIYKVEIPNRK